MISDLYCYNFEQNETVNFLYIEVNANKIKMTIIMEIYNAENTMIRYQFMLNGI